LGANKLYLSQYALGHVWENQAFVKFKFFEEHKPFGIFLFFIVIYNLECEIRKYICNF
jgi:hypothetical protein